VFEKVKSKACVWMRVLFFAVDFSKFGCEKALLPLQCKTRTFSKGHAPCFADSKKFVSSKERARNGRYQLLSPKKNITFNCGLLSCHIAVVF
jgi:hypothetical protein